MQDILISDNKGVLVYSGIPLSRENTQITDIYVTFDDNSDNYSNYRAEEDTIKSAEFSIVATGNKNDGGEDDQMTVSAKQTAHGGDHFLPRVDGRHDAELALDGFGRIEDEVLAKPAGDELCSHW